MAARRPEKQDGPSKSCSLSFWVVGSDREPQYITLSSEKQAAVIGRSPLVDIRVNSSVVSNCHCELIFHAKNREPTLYLKDKSTNHTGVRCGRSGLKQREFYELENGDSEPLTHQSKILVPARLPPGRPAALQQELTILFELPDMYLEWTRKGRWLYHEPLGEGGLATVYRATDMTGGLGEVAVKLSKFQRLPRASGQNRHVYALHREAQWSMQRLHNVANSRYKPEGASLFVRYLEDHTGFQLGAKSDFDAQREKYEDPAFVWAEHEFAEGQIAKQPYVVMELVKGRLLQSVFEAKPPTELPEKKAIVVCCAEALVYMQSFGVMHRDFRGCNIFCVGSGGDCRIKVIDLGFMVTTQEFQIKNPNPAVRCAWQGDPARRFRFDWAPPEVRKRGSPNYAQPSWSFDVFSFGIVVLKLLKGRAWVQENMNDPDSNLRRSVLEPLNPSSLGLNVDLMLRVINNKDPTARPSPSEILRAVSKPLTTPFVPVRKVQPASQKPPTAVEKAAPPDPAVVKRVDPATMIPKTPSSADLGPLSPTSVQHPAQEPASSARGSAAPTAALREDGADQDDRKRPPQAARQGDHSTLQPPPPPPPLAPPPPPAPPAVPADAANMSGQQSGYERRQESADDNASHGGKASWDGWYNNDWNSRRRAQHDDWNQDSNWRRSQGDDWNQDKSRRRPQDEEWRFDNRKRRFQDQDWKQDEDWKQEKSYKKHRTGWEQASHDHSWGWRDKDSALWRQTGASQMSASSGDARPNAWPAARAKARAPPVQERASGSDRWQRDPRISQRGTADGAM